MAMARFRLFGRAPDASAAPGAGEHANPGPQPYVPPPWPSAAPPVGAGAPWPVAGPATRAARPASSPADPPTDPRGFPPVPAAAPAHPAPAPPVPPAPAPAAPPPPVPAPPIPPAPGWPAPPPWQGPSAIEMPDPVEAAALAGAFAADYLSWDEDDPARRGRVLRDYLSVPGNDPAHLGWSGEGRQRAEFALPGRVRPDGEGRVLVDVRVRVTPYRAVGDHEARGQVPEPEPEVGGVPAAAPAPTGRGWRSLASCWIRLSVPVVLEGGRLAIDAWEETLGDDPPPAPPPAPAVDDHTLADDDPLAEPRKEGVW
jgi:hypothetical protein